MKKLTLAYAMFLGLVAGAAHANTKQIPSQFHGCWSTAIGGEIYVQLDIKKNKIIQNGEATSYEGKVTSVKNNGKSYSVKTTGIMYGEMDQERMSLPYNIQLNGKNLIVNKDKFKRCG